MWARQPTRSELSASNLVACRLTGWRDVASSSSGAGAAVADGPLGGSDGDGIDGPDDDGDAAGPELAGVTISGRERHSKISRTMLSRTKPPMAIFAHWPFARMGMLGSIALALGRQAKVAAALGDVVRTSVMTDNASFAILCVCTGNVCRSPAAERLLATRLGPTVSVRSAGTHALAGDPMAPPMTTLVTAGGAMVDGFFARQLQAGLVRTADLVLGMTREHRALAVDVWPGAVRRAFTLLEFARLAREVDPDGLPAGTPAERLTALVPLVSARRRMVTADVDDVVDPYGQQPPVYERSFSAIRDAADLIAARVVGQSG